MPIPDADRAVVEESKLVQYLLNPDHPDGGAKARWFGSRGYKRSNWRLLRDHLLAIGRQCPDFETERTPFGVKFIASGGIGVSGFPAGTVRTVWIVNTDGYPRLVTAYPIDAP